MKRHCLLAALLLTAALPHAPAATITSTWLAAANGNWNDGTQWDSNPTFPNNAGATTFDAIINAAGPAYTVTLNTGITVEDLLLSSANATLSHTTGIFSATGAISLNAGKYALAGGTIANTTVNFVGGALEIAASNSNLLTGVSVLGELLFGLEGRTKIAGGTTFTTARMTRSNNSLGFAPGQTLASTIIVEGADFGTRAVEMDGNAGTFTVGPTGVIRTAAGTNGDLSVGASFWYGGAMALANQGLISSQASGRTVTVNPNTLNNTGTLEAKDGGILNITPATTWANAGTIALSGNGIVNLLGTFNTTAGIGTWANSGGTVNLNGTINNAGNTLTLNNATGSWTLNGGAISGGTLAYADGKSLLFTATNANRLDAVTLTSDLTLDLANTRTKIAGGTTFPTAHLANNQTGLGFAPGQTFNGTILADGTPAGTRAIEMDGTAGSFTLGPTGIIRNVGASADLQIGGPFWFSGAMALANQGLISSQVNGRTVTVNPNTLNNTGTIEARNGGILNINPATTWTNAGNISALLGSPVTLGGPWSNAGGTIAADATSTLNFGGSFATANLGTLSLAAGSRVNVTGAWNNTGGTFTFNTATGSWVLAGGSITGGTLASAAGQGLTIGANANANLLTGVTFTGDLTLDQANARTKIAGGTTFPTAHLANNNTSLGFAPGQIFNGTILADGALAGARAVELDGTNGAFTLGPTGVIRTAAGVGGDLQIGSPFWFGGAMALTNQGLISSQANGRTVTVNPNALTNTGTLEAKDGGILDINPTTTWSNAGTIALSTGGIVNLRGTLDATAGVGTFDNVGGTVNLLGTLTNTGNALFLDGTTGSWHLAGGTINGGSLTFLNGATAIFDATNLNRLNGVTVNSDLTLGVSGGRTRIGAGTTFPAAHLTNINAALAFAPGQTFNGTIAAEGALAGTRAVELDGNPGTFTLGPTGTIRIDPGSASDLQVGGTFWFGGTMTLLNQGVLSSGSNGRLLTIGTGTVFTNAGLLETKNGGLLSIPGGYTQTAGVTRFDGGALNAGASAPFATVTIASGRLEGRATLNTNVVNSGTIAPGLSAGTLTILRDLTLNGTAKLEIEIGGTSQGTQYDLLSEAGTVPLTLGGELLVTFINGFQSSVQPADSFTILTSNAAITGAFSNVVGGRVFTADGAGSFAVTVSGNNVILGAFVVPEPTTALLLASGLLLLRRRRAE